MPRAIVFGLRPASPGTSTPALGRAAHAAMLEQIGAADAALAARLHADVHVKPLTVAPLHGFDPRGAPVPLLPARLYELRVTLLAPALEALAAQWQAAHPPELHFDGMAWRVERVATEPAEHPWAGHASFEALLASAMRAAASPHCRRWTLDFCTPVTFRQRGRNQPLPLPELVFGSLLDRWNALAPLPLPDEARQFIAEALVVSQFDMRSASAPTKGGAVQIGALGRCTYTAMSNDRYGLACVEALARFAFYSGVGAGTARGFGQARITGEPVARMVGLGV